MACGVSFSIISFDLFTINSIASSQLAGSSLPCFRMSCGHKRKEAIALSQPYRSCTSQDSETHWRLEPIRMPVVLPTAHSLGSESALVDPIHRPSSDPDNLAVCNTDIRTTSVLRVRDEDKLLPKRD